MNRGFVKVFRKLLNSRVFQSEGLLKVWLWCLLKANHTGAWVSVKTGRGIVEIRIESGQFIFGRETAAKELRMSPSTVWKRMLKLKNLENLNIESNRHCSIVTIRNWHTYQDRKRKSDSEGDYRVTAKEHKQECIEGKEINMRQFDAFYFAYPKKRARRKAMDAWKKLDFGNGLFHTIMAALEKQKKSDDWLKNGGQFIPYPASWLNGERWKDETQEVKTEW